MRLIDEVIVVLFTRLFSIVTKRPSLYTLACLLWSIAIGCQSRHTEVDEFMSIIVYFGLSTSVVLNLLRRPKVAEVGKI